ncbi:GDSL esterase/lipase At1g54790-like [Momordica charantia]|uniref:GDSL esterase/lipase At1g54790-like n=1 Tax=Momordica charantia TaxID=3673 RepID=A0A6J1DAZ2_MOMCH|nr:GDSL esterase/lipase At1g54790-like [Momordica charantia]
MLMAVFQIFFFFFFLLCVPIARSSHSSPAAVFNFGDSNSDTGCLVDAGIETVHPPYGYLFFGKPSGRYCDGRLVIDFLMDAMAMPFLTPYLDSIGLPNFRKGCNYAAAGSTVLPPTFTSVSPFSLNIQVNQFLHFKARVLELRAAKGGKKFDKYLPAEDDFKKGLYMFNIGQNDLNRAFYNQTLDQVIPFIPSILAEFETGVQRVYEQGARNFWIHNTGPLGCLAQNLVRFGTDPSKLDEFGCISSHNQAAKLFNLQLHALSKQLQARYTDASVTYVDVHTIKLNLIANYSQLGFEQPIMACCGYGGPPFNFDNTFRCGSTKTVNGTVVTVGRCNDSSKYVSWDGIHYSEAANKYVSSQILTGKYSDPPFSPHKMPYLVNRKL